MTKQEFLNKIIPIIENMAEMDIKLPKKLVDSLEQIKGRGE